MATSNEERRARAGTPLDATDREQDSTLGHDPATLELRRLRADVAFLRGELTRLSQDLRAARHLALVRLERWRQKREEAALYYRLLAKARGQLEAMKPVPPASEGPAFCARLRNQLRTGRRITLLTASIFPQPTPKGQS